MPEPTDRPDLTVIVFSKDRPLQLHATLASLRATCQDADRLRVRVLVYASDDAMAARYQRVAAELPWAELVGEDGFKPTLLAAAAGSRHLAFVVDDCLFVRPWRAASATALLDRVPEVLGVSLRLGRNTTWCYTLDRAQRVPPLLGVGDGWLALDWTAADADFGYPLELSSSIYRAEDLLPLLEALPYRDPNGLESSLAAQRDAFRARRPVLACAEASLAFCTPLNVVQTTFENRSGGRADRSPEALGVLFDQGARVEVARLAGFTPRGCHEEVDLPLPAVPATGPAAPAAPAVSIVIPCHGQAAYLEFAVHSVALQTFTDWELIVVDDGSPDDTAGTVRRLAAALPGRRLRLLRQPNAGLANARNAGIRAARGRYVLPLDADDALHADFLARAVAALEADPAVDIVSTHMAVFGARSYVCTTSAIFTVEKVLESTPFAYASLYRRKVWEQVGGYAPNMTAGYEDWDFWVGAAERGLRATVVPEPLFLYRQKAESMLTSARRHDRALRARLLLNHPAHFAPEHLAAARAVLTGAPLPPEKPATLAVEEDLGAPVPAAAPAPAPGPSAPIHLGFLLIGTGRYAAFFPPLRESIRRHLAIPGAEPHFFFFTDGDGAAAAAPDTTVLRVDHLPWPLVTLLRYKVFLDHAAALQGMDYLYYLDVDCRVVDAVGPALLGRLVAVSHPGYHGKPRAAFTYETRATSRACIGPHEGTRYYAGGLQGGEREAYLGLARAAHAGICDDLARNLIAVWHDESHLNRYLVDHPPSVVLDPSYLYPESWQLPFPRRILALDKDHGAIRREGAAPPAQPRAAAAQAVSP